MGVVHVQIDERAADFFGVPKVLEPEWVGNDALEMAAEEFSILAARYGGADKGVLGQKGEALADQNLLFCFLGGLHNCVAFGGREAHRLFDQDVLAGAKGGDRSFGVQVWRQADIDQVDRGVTQEPIKARVLCHATQIDLLARRTEIALDSSPVAAELSFFARADRGELDSLRFLIREVVNPTHEADAEEANSKHEELQGLEVRVRDAQTSFWKRS